MSISFDFEWHDLQGRAEADVAATMARLEIHVNGGIVTRAFDKRGRSVRDGIITPLAPIAEWIAANWWALLQECATRARSDDEFETRHFLRAAGRGFPLPDLRIVSEGETAHCDWRPRSTEFSAVDFFSQGAARVPTSELRDKLWNFLEAVVSRLNDRHVVDARVLDLWNAVRATTPDEIPFCQLAGRLGLDPYEIEPSLAQQVAALDQDLSSEIRDEFAAAVSADRLSEGVQWVRTGLAELRKRSHAITTPLTLPRVSIGPANGTPWSRGYRLAREFRQAVGQTDQGPFDFTQLGSTTPLLTATRDNPTGMNAVVRLHGNEPLFYASPQRPESQRFLRARSLFAYCMCPHAQEALLTSAHTAWQQQSRAFAAELLAPEAYLRARVRRETLESDEAGELAAELGVSQWVVERQLFNHQIARIELSDIG